MQPGFFKAYRHFYYHLFFRPVSAVYQHTFFDQIHCPDIWILIHRILAILLFAFVKLNSEKLHHYKYCSAICSRQPAFRESEFLLFCNLHSLTGIKTYCMLAILFCNLHSPTWIQTNCASLLFCNFHSPKRISTNCIFATELPSLYLRANKYTSEHPPLGFFWICNLLLAL